MKFIPATLSICLVISFVISESHGSSRLNREDFFSEGDYRGYVAKEKRGYFFAPTHTSEKEDAHYILGREQISLAISCIERDKKISYFKNAKTHFELSTSSKAYKYSQLCRGLDLLPNSNKSSNSTSSKILRVPECKQHSKRPFSSNPNKVALNPSIIPNAENIVYLPAQNIQLPPLQIQDQPDVIDMVFPEQTLLLPPRLAQRQLNTAVKDLLE